MRQFFAENWGTLLVGFVLLAVVALVIFKLCRDKRKGRSSCGCNCGDCPASKVCHKK